ncbi:unnamed protein product [Oncorhynchus mykiss]|uniref:Ubiquitin-like domain-containing protein n=1 Tax=Oncorhynchus mykiss TaxID=8022 RepID=A0A060XS65_ONCMY|nr:unnamed protein product [Oncorhynchus mykiss]
MANVCVCVVPRFLLKDGQLWLCAPQAKQIWKCLAENAVFLCDREACFKWYSKLMGDEPDLDPDINKDFFENNVLQLDPSLLTENGMKCFERFFKAVNCREGKLVAKRRAYMMDDLELIGLDYLWRVVIQGSDDIASRAIDLLKEIYTNLGPKLQVNQVEIHEDFIQSCFDRLKASYDTLCVLEGDKDSINCARQEAIRMVRVLTVLKEYINECDSDYHEERTILPMSRAFRGKHITLIVRFPNQGRQVDDLDIWSHTNDTIGSVRRGILTRIKANATHTKIELFIGGEVVDPADDRKLIGQLNLKDKTVSAMSHVLMSHKCIFSLTIYTEWFVCLYILPCVCVCVVDHSQADPGECQHAFQPRQLLGLFHWLTGNHGNHFSEGPNPEVESCLPGVVSDF